MIYTKEEIQRAALKFGVAEQSTAQLLINQMDYDRKCNLSEGLRAVEFMQSIQTICEDYKSKK